jgi:hypothetical protein
VRHDPSTFARTSASSRPDTGIRLADLVAAFSLATDLGLGQPMEHALRSWRIASRLGERMGIEPEARASLYYVVTLAWVGCVADTPEVANWFGDDIAYRRDSFGVDRAGLPMMAYSLRRVGAGSPLVHRLRLAATLVATGGAPITRGFMSHCISTARMAERLGLGEAVADQLQQVFTRWDGKGVPSGVGGERIAPTVPAVPPRRQRRGVAQDAGPGGCSRAGAGMARHAVRPRRGGRFLRSAREGARRRR